MYFLLLIMSKIDILYLFGQSMTLILFFRYFKQKVSEQHSTVKISDEVPRNDNSTISTVKWTARLEEIFKQNAQHDEYLR